MNKILILGTKNYDYDLNNVLIKKGFDVYFCGNSRSPLIPKDKWININYTDITSLNNFINLNKDFKYIIPGSNDLAYLSVSELIYNKNLNNLIKIDTLKVAKDYLLKSRFRKNQLSNFVNFPKKLDIQNIKNREEKFLLKNDGLSGGKGIFFFENWIEFKKAKNNINYNRDSTFEDFIDGSGHAASFFLVNKKIRIEFFDNEYYAKDKLAVIATSTPTLLNENLKEKLRNFCKEYATKQNLCDGLFHIQCIKSKEKIFIIECTRRLPGDYYHIFSSLYLQKSYLTYYVNGFLNEVNDVQKEKEKNNHNKCVVRVVCDEKIKYTIDSNETLQNIIKKNLISEMPLDGYRFGEGQNKFKKDKAIFLTFNQLETANKFCKNLSEKL